MLVLPPNIATAWQRYTVVLTAIFSFLLSACDNRKVIFIETRPNVTVKFLYIFPKSNKEPVAHLILFTGGDGKLGLNEGSIKDAGSLKPAYQSDFLARTRDNWVAQGFAVALPDVPSGQKGLYLPRRGNAMFRTSPEHKEDIQGIIEFLKSQKDIPVWLVGTSMGTISAANVAAQLPPGTIDGVVLTSSVFGITQKPLDYGLRGLSAKELGRIKVPTLWAHNKKDECPLTLFTDVEGFMKMQHNSPKVELMTFEKGTFPRGSPCSPFHYHGFIGFEDEVVTKISNWIKANL